MTTETHGGATGMTVAEWAGLPEDTPGELLDGRLVEEEVPDSIHEVVVSWLIGTLRAWILARRGLVFGSEAKFALERGLGRKPDVSLYLPDSKKPRRSGPIDVPPDLMVEVISARARDARRDRIEKPDEYARFGVRHYWIVDPQARVLEAYELDAQARYVRVAAAGEGDVTIPGFDGLTLHLDALWEETELLRED